MGIHNDNNRVGRDVINNTINNITDSSGSKGGIVVLGIFALFVLGVVVIFALNQNTKTSTSPTNELSRSLLLDSINNPTSDEKSDAKISEMETNDGRFGSQKDEIEDHQQHLICDAVEYSDNLDTLKKVYVKSIEDSYEVKEGTKVIGTTAFRGCKKLYKVILPSTITEIQSAAFEKCSNLEEINLPDGLESIDQFAFCDCRSLRLLSLPKGLKYLGSNPFYGLDSIDIKIPVGAKYKMDGAFLIDSKHKKLISYVGNESDIVIPSEITTIGDYSFAKNVHIVQVHLNNVEVIENFAFEYCRNIKIIEFGKKLNKIRLNPFKP